jgi:hypothetical protein
MRKLFTLLAAAIFTLAANTSMAAPVLYGLGNTDIGTARNASNLYTIDTATGAASFVGVTGANLRGLTINQFTGRAYASATAGGLFEVNLGTGAAALVGGTQAFSEMAFDGAGNLYGYGRRNEPNAYNFYSIDHNTGASTLLNASALNPGNHALFGISYSIADDAMYLYQKWFDGSGGEGLSTIDLTDGTATSIVTGGPHAGNRPRIAEDDSGNLYAMDPSTITNLYTVDKTTGDTTAVGSTGVGINSMSFANSVAVPEPGAMALFGLGLVGLGFARRRRSAA